MKKNGFIFVETICVIVILLTALLLLYSSFNKTITKEQRYLYYDDISYVYKAEYIKRVMYDSVNVDDSGTNYFANYIIKNTTCDNKLTVFNSDQTDGNNKYIFSDNGRANIENMFKLYNVWQAFYVKTEDIDDIKNGSFNSSCIYFKSDSDVIDDIINAFTFDKNKNFFTNYLKKLDVEDADNHQGILIFVFVESKNGKVSDLTKLRNYKSCFNDEDYTYTAKSMSCEFTPYLAWVYYD